MASTDIENVVDVEERVSIASVPVPVPVTASATDSVVDVV